MTDPLGPMQNDQLGAEIAAAMRERFPMLDQFKSFELAAIALAIVRANEQESS